MRNTELFEKALSDFNRIKKIYVDHVIQINPELRNESQLLTLERSGLTLKRWSRELSNPEKKQANLRVMEIDQELLALRERAFEIATDERPNPEFSDALDAADKRVEELIGQPDVEG